MTNQKKNEQKIDIEKVLKEKLPVIDEVIAKYIPKIYDERTLEYTLGPATYKYDLKAINKAITKPVWDILERGGKRWRPVLFLLILEAFSENPRRFTDFAIIPELVHNGTLIVDDLEDRSEFRRGKKCIHEIYGEDVAVNAGNTIYFLPLLLLIKNIENVPVKRQKAIYDVYAQEMINISFGQGTDIAWHRGLVRDEEITDEHYLQMTAYKTGTLARMSAKIAAILCGLNLKSIHKIGRFAESVGIAFQIQDDILDLKGEKFAVKKGGLGKDITEGKRTLMVINTIRKADAQDRERLIQILRNHTKNQMLIDEAISLMEKYGAIEYAKNVATQIVTKSWNDIEGIIPQSEAKDMLKAFVTFLVERAI